MCKFFYLSISWVYLEESVIITFFSIICLGESFSSMNAIILMSKLLGYSTPKDLVFFFYLNYLFIIIIIFYDLYYVYLQDYAFRFWVLTCLPSL